ncbi:MAG: hypothetical protein KR126chlam1_00369 [Chlamydiae bacterium]|nr:hypothetical protein [Chlamydiota bacterium]
MNELYFLSQILCIILFSYGALRLGKGALFTAITMQAVLANLFVLKQMSFFGFEVTCSDAFAIGSILGLNLLREHFGADSAKKGISICFFFMVFFAVMSQLHLLFTPSVHDTAHAAYARLLTPAPRLLFASLLSFYLVQHLDIRLFGLISNLLPRSKFPTRSTLSLVISQLADTILFSFLGLYGMVARMSHIILISFCLKALIILLMGPISSLFYKLEKNPS